MTEFKLSDKRKETNVIGEYFIPKDVKEFIRVLKGEIDMNMPHCKNIGDVWKVIDKVAGDLEWVWCMILIKIN